MATVTFYKTKMNRSNRAYDGAALDTILNAAPKLAFDVPNGVIPNVPFVIRSGETAAITDILNGYDYITYTYSGKTFYAFLDSVQFLATSVGNCSVMHSTDAWAMAVKYSADTLHFNGNLAQAHVNDLKFAYKLVDKQYAYLDMTNTSATCEAYYNKQLVKRKREKMQEFSEENYYLYIYIANAERVLPEIFTGEPLQDWFPDGLNKRSFPTYGLLLVYPAYIDKTGGAYYYYTDNENIEESTIHSVNIETLTSGDISGMVLSKIHPVSAAENSSDTNSKLYALHDYNGRAFWSTDYTEDYGFIVHEVPESLKKGLPSYLNYFGKITGSQVGLQTAVFPSPVLEKYNNYNDYLRHIPKMISSIYEPVYLNDNVLPCENGTLYTNGFNVSHLKMSYTPDLMYLSIILPDDNTSFLSGAERQILLPNRGLFRPETTEDYWTRLNAYNMSLSAQQMRVNTGYNLVKSFMKTVGNVSAMAMASTVPGVGTALSAALAPAAGNSVDKLIQATIDATFATKQADVISSIANMQYNAGDTNEYSASNSYVSYMNKNENVFWKLSVEQQYGVIAPQLHRYGYNTFLQIDEVYSHHKRECFNFFKGVDVSVNGLQADWCDEIASMFNSGVTLWQSDVENYERVNYQQGLWEDN